VQEFDVVALFEFLWNVTVQFYMISFIKLNPAISPGCSWMRFGVSWERETPSA
jgi:hypothetical protein